MGVVSAAMRFGGIDLMNTEWISNSWSEVAALVAYVALIWYFIKASMSGPSPNPSTREGSK